MTYSGAEASNGATANLAFNNAYKMETWSAGKIARPGVEKVSTRHTEGVCHVKPRRL
jgi:hypothetical protein